MRNRNSFEVRDSLNIFDLKHLNLQLGIPKDELCDVSENIKEHYNSEIISIKKPDDTIKERVIYHPTERLRKILEAIDDYLLKKIKLPDYIHGARKGHNNITNAEPHVGKKHVLTSDIADCYPSISVRKVRSLFIRLKCTPEVSACLTKLCTADNHLPQGYNTSPRIAVLVLQPATDRIWRLCKKYGITFTVYIDDLTMSGNKDLSPFKKTIDKIINDYGLKIKSEKTKPLSQNQQHKVTGIVVNKKINVDKESFNSMRYTLHICKKYGPANIIGKVTDSKGRKIETVERLKNNLRGKLNYIKNINPQKANNLMIVFNDIRW